MELVPMVVRLAPPAGSGGGGGGAGAGAGAGVGVGDVDGLEEEVVVVDALVEVLVDVLPWITMNASTQTHVPPELEFLVPVTSTARV